MSRSTITALSAASALDGTEVFPADQGGSTKKATGAQIAALLGFGWFYGTGIDGPRTDSGSGAGSAISQARDYTTWAISNATTIRGAGYYAVCRTSLALEASCALHNDGVAGTDSAQTGGSGSGIAGVLEFSHSSGGSGGSAGSAGSPGANQTNAYGGAGGKGGAGVGAGGAGGTITAPNTSSVGRFDFWTCKHLQSSNYTQVQGGAPGGGGGGGTGVAGAGGGCGGGVLWVAAKTITLGSGARISANGGRGGNNANLNGGGGGGGGGGLVVVICDLLNLTDAAASHFTATGGAAGAASNGGSNGVAGSNGRVLVFERGILRYASP